jgi:hypothetical protein
VITSSGTLYNESGVPALFISHVRCTLPLAERFPWVRYLYATNSKTPRLEPS